MMILLVLMSLLGLTTTAHADPRILAPPSTKVAIGLSVVGLLPIEGTFERFEGRIEIDPARPGTCQVQLRIETASLSMTSETVREEAIGPGFLDHARFPVIRFDGGFDGGCEGDAIRGKLDMHGVTRPFALEVDRSGPMPVATGGLRRTDWGMDARRWLVGETVYITVTTPLLVAPAAPGNR